MSSIAFVIAHHDPAGRAPLYLRALAAYLRAMTPDVVLVSSGMDDAAASEMGSLVRVVRHEHGADVWWSYKLGLEVLGDNAERQRLVLLDATLFVLHPHLLVERALASAGSADLVGLTACRRPDDHLQSHWLSFHGRRILDSAPFAQWWSSIVPPGQRAGAQAGEIAMTRWFSGHGFRLTAAFQPDRAAKLIALCRAFDCNAIEVQLPASGPVSIDPDESEALDPTIFCWDKLLEQFGAVRLDLLHSSPLGANAARLQQWIDSDDPDASLARDAIARSAARSR